MAMSNSRRSSASDNDDQYSIIDVYEFDDTDSDRWLCTMDMIASGSDCSNNKIVDLDAWLRADTTETECVKSNPEQKKYIDTRTFTRAKRKSIPFNFSNFNEEPKSETKSPVFLKVFENPLMVSESHNNDDICDDSREQRDMRESVPMMLRPKANQVLSTLLSESPTSLHGQASMEAFLNVSHSKSGHASFITDSNESELNHMLMNISQPSLLYSSIISDNRDESLQMTIPGSFVDSQILTDSMMEVSMFKEVADTTTLAEFLKKNNDDSEPEDKTFCKSNSLDENNKTIESNSNSLNETRVISKEAINPLDETHIIQDDDLEADLNATQILNSDLNTFDVTKVIIPKNKFDLESDNNDNTFTKVNETFEIEDNNLPAKKNIDSKFQTFRISSKLKPKINVPITKTENILNTTFDASPKSLREELLQEVQRGECKLNSTFNYAPVPEMKPLDSKLVHQNSEHLLRKTFILKPNLDATYVHQDQEELTVGKTFNIKNETFVQESLSNEIKSKTSDSNTNSRTLESISRKNNTSNLNQVKNAKNIPEPQTKILQTNRYGTYRKDNLRSGSYTSKAKEIITENLANKETNNQNLRRYTTFTRNIVTEKNDIYKERTIDARKSDFQFIKPLSKEPRKLQEPKSLSKLPNLFQKSNPNLASNLKSMEIPLGSNIGFNKGSQPNISTNTCTLSKLKSDSDQKLQQYKRNIENSLGLVNSGSLESISSSASAHSAPDTINKNIQSTFIENMNKTISNPKLPNLDEYGNIGGSTPKRKGIPIFESALMESKDLPSPILKNGMEKIYSENCSSGGSSPAGSTEYITKTSSPIHSSPSASDKEINSVGSNDGGTESCKENISAENKNKQIQVPSATSKVLTGSTKLRRPTNYVGANKLGNGTGSGIPRPASRIPAPKFSRPNMK